MCGDSGFTSKEEHLKWLRQCELMCFPLRKWDAKSYLLLLVGDLRVSQSKHLHLQRKEVAGHVLNSTCLCKGRGSPRPLAVGPLGEAAPGDQ